MPYTRRILHTRFARHLPRFFPSRVNIERPVFSQTASGDTTGAPTFDIVYRNVPAAVSAVIRLGEEWRNWRLEFVLEQVTHRVMLKGYFPDILASDRMVTAAGEIHNISARHLDSHSNLTRLDTRIVSPEAIAGVS